VLEECCQELAPQGGQDGRVLGTQTAPNQYSFLFLELLTSPHLLPSPHLWPPELELVLFWNQWLSSPRQALSQSEKTRRLFAFTVKTGTQTLRSQTPECLSGWFQSLGSWIRGRGREWSN